MFDTAIRPSPSIMVMFLIYYSDASSLWWKFNPQETHVVLSECALALVSESPMFLPSWGTKLSSCCPSIYLVESSHV
jgi:ABC-type arginine transport system permease subunit